MRPEVRFKSARRCQGKQTHQGNGCVHAAIGKQQSFWDSRAFHTFLQLFGFSSWELSMQYGGTQASHTYTDLLTVIVIMSAFIMGIKFIDFRLIFYILLNQFIFITIMVLVATILLRTYLSMQADTCCTVLSKLKGLERSSRRH